MGNGDPFGSEGGDMGGVGGVGSGGGLCGLVNLLLLLLVVGERERERERGAPFRSNQIKSNLDGIKLLPIYRVIE